MNMISWLGGLPDSVHLKGRRIDLSSHAAAAAAVANDTESISGAIVGMLKFSFHARYDHLLSLNENERDQYNFWTTPVPGRRCGRASVAVQSGAFCFIAASSASAAVHGHTASRIDNRNGAGAARSFVASKPEYARNLRAACACCVAAASAGCYHVRSLWQV